MPGWRCSSLPSPRPPAEEVDWTKGDYAFPLYEANYGTVQHNTAALRMLTSYVSNCIPYVIEGDNVIFNTSKEVVE